MSELVLISHGELSKQLKATAEMIMGPQAHVHAVCLLPNDGPETFRTKLENTLAGLSEVTVFADLLGGTPCNTASRLLLEEAADFSLYAGMNLPMVISYINAELVNEPADYVAEAKQGVVYVNPLLAAHTDDDE
ncbi:PTS sugar transporter subunit IIA [Lacticaseibacillus jixiensis]|uniref:PTS sugar transporter subunit IIA n=1 Tax=Lacticaseibacillus jixiensis TaxID=3231926 RepID=UPI0036F2555F